MFYLTISNPLPVLPGNEQDHNTLTLDISA